MVAHPLEVFVCVGRINNYEVVVVSSLVNDQVIYCSALLVAHRTVTGLPVLHVCEVVGQNVVQVLQAVRSGNQNLPHVGYIEETNSSSYCHVLLLDAGLVLNWKNESAEWDHLSAVLHMSFVKWCFLLHFPCLHCSRRNTREFYHRGMGASTNERGCKPLFSGEIELSC